MGVWDVCSTSFLLSAFYFLLHEDATTQELDRCEQHRHQKASARRQGCVKGFDGGNKLQLQQQLQQQ